ncbi:putative oxidoreductase [Hyaloscypha bicolor E]|uniref:Putative oxidoreductase n=1 Tax=Hyaloscypha bicolor E TaxID=1095630 RepID=A0A2J6T4G7_9HELO|nr:putative oxidoreductase [Hyaloscypha bicolor E]PMD57896.1 putative oxidoreductase [Hyaloscypha bicolor E]
MTTETITNTHASLYQESEDFSFPTLPPFPADIPTAPLLRLSLSSLRSSSEESGRFFTASKELGFFYLDLRNDPLGEELLSQSSRFFDLAPKFYKLGREELSKYDYKNVGSYMGYKGFGSAVVDEKGNLDRNEFYNIPKDDFFGISEKPFTHPDILYQNTDLIKSYINNSHALITLLLNHLNTHLQLPEGTLQSLHRLNEPSGDQIRIIKSPPQPPSDQHTALGKHTDFGSLTLLFNQLGGLQILPPPSLTPAGKEPEWTYVKPLRGHCIINLGDAMTKFTGGLLRSNIHRVVSPPGEQAEETRYSVVYFSRPEDEVVLKRLEGGVIPNGQDDGEAMNSKEWIKLQALRLRKVGVEKSEEERRRLWEETGRGS